MKNLFRNVFLSVCTLFLFGANNNLIAQSAEADFLIVIKTTEKGVELSCIQGCNFKELTFTLKVDESQLVDNSGMASLSAVEKKDTNPYEFLFSVERTEDGAVLKGIRGTLWEKLHIEYNPNLTHAFNQNGHVH